MHPEAASFEAAHLCIPEPLSEIHALTNIFSDHEQYLFETGYQLYGSVEPVCDLKHSNDILLEERTLESTSEADNTTPSLPAARLHNFLTGFARPLGSEWRGMHRDRSAPAGSIRP